jgi:oxygen-dependent protoporphyrinogen oxidase
MVRRVVVVGGGVSGLATAYFLTSDARHPPEVSVLEARPRTGGWVRTDRLAGLAIDTGPDSLLVRAPLVDALLTELGLDGARRQVSSDGAYIWARGRLRRLPRGSVFGVPNRIGSLVRSGVVSPLGLLRAGADLVLPRGAGTAGQEDPTIEQLIRPRLGRQVFENLVEPLLGGVHAGRASTLSARSAVPDVAALAAAHRSLFLAARGAPPRTGGGPGLVGLDGGMSRLVEALEGALAERGVRLRCVAEVVALTSTDRDDRRGYRVVTVGGEPVEADDVVLATPAWRTAELLAQVAPAAAGAAAGIGYAGVATVSLAYHPGDLPGPLVGTGFLVPPAQGRLLVGCTWLTSKWPQLSGAPVVVLRAMVGRDDDQRWAGMDDAELLARVRGELAEAIGVRAEPAAHLVRRMPRAMPQYAVGHADRVAALEAGLAARGDVLGGGLSGLWVTGAGYRGPGLASCISAARDTATAVLARPLGAAARPVG